MGVFDTISAALQGKVQKPSDDVASGKSSEGNNGPSDTKTTKGDMNNLRDYKTELMRQKGLDFEGNPLTKQDKKQSDKKKKPTYQRLYKDTK